MSEGTAHDTPVVAMRDEGDMIANQEGVTVESTASVYDMAPPTTEPTPLETAVLEFVNVVANAEPGEFGSKTANFALKLGETVQESLSARLATPKLLEVTGNVEEKELAARYMDQKAQAATRMGFDHAAQMFVAAAAEFRQGLHLPEVVIEGRVIPYNEDNDTGIRHAEAINIARDDVHARNVKAGWWHDLDTGEPKDRNAGELIALCHSELSEALEGVRKNRMDDHLPDRKMEEVEMADCVIRILDYCGGRGLDLGGAIDAKLAYNAQRPDHKVENRLKADGKKI